MLTISIEDGGMTTLVTGMASRLAFVPREAWEDVGGIVAEYNRQTFEVGGRPVAWPPSQAALRENRKTLVKSGKLKNSIQVSDIGPFHVVVSGGEGAPYGMAHQFGFDGVQPVTEKQRGFFWSKYYESKGTGDSALGGKTTETGEAQKWKRMALSTSLRVHVIKREWFNVPQNLGRVIADYLGKYFTTGART